MFPTGCHVPYTYATFYRLFPEEWPANLLPASGSYCSSCRSGVALHLQERFTGPVLKRKPCQPSQVNISILIIFIDISTIYLYNIFSVNYYHLRVFFLSPQRSRSPETALPSEQSNYNDWNTTVQTPPARVNILYLFYSFSQFFSLSFCLTICGW